MNSKIVSSLLIALLFLGIMAAVSPRAFASPTTVRVISEKSELGDPVTMPNIVGTEFSIAVVIEDVVDLYGIDVQINWTTKYLHCIDHTMTIPVDDFPDPIPPSPYPGILHTGMAMGGTPIVNESDSIPGAEPGAMGYWSYVSLGTPEFNGSGTVAVLTFRVMDQPWDYEGVDHVNATIHFVSVKLADTGGDPIPFDAEDFDIKIYPRLFEYPPLPMLKVSPSSIEGELGVTFPVDVLLMDEHERDLSPFWDIAGFDMYLNFNSTLMEALDVTIDPDGWWAGFWSGGVIEAAKEIDNTAGTVHIAFLGIPTIDGVHTEPWGIGRLVTVDFKATFEYIGYPPPTASIWLKNPVSTYDWIELDYEGGILTLTSPLDTDWHQLVPTAAYCTPYKLEAWLDSDTDLKLSSGDEVRLTNRDNGKWRDCIVTEIAGVMGATMNNWTETDEPIGRYAGGWSPLLVFDTPGVQVSTYKILDFAGIHVKFANGTERDLTTDEYTVFLGTHQVNITVCLDSLIVENMTLGVDCGLPWVEYPSGNAANEIISVKAYFPYGDTLAYNTSITNATDRLVALQSSTDFGWDWNVTGLATHSGSPSSTNLYGVTALGLLDAYKLTGNSAYFNASKDVADWMAWGNASEGDFYNGHDGFYFGFSFDYQFLMEFAEVSGNSNYSDYAVAAWDWQKENRGEYYGDGNQTALYNYMYAHYTTHGGAVWGSADFALAALCMGDTTWAENMSEVIRSNLTKIDETDDYKYIGWGKSLELLQAVNSTAHDFTTEITTVIGNLTETQNAEGFWDTTATADATQNTAYAIMGLMAVNEVDIALNGSEWLISTQLTNGGWGTPNEYSEIDSEAAQALYTMLQTIGLHPETRMLIEDTDWYYDPAWPCEIEMDIADPSELVDGTILEATYKGVASANITSYTAIEDVDVSWMRYEGTYEEFLGVTDPMYTLWEERYPSFMKEFNVTGWEDDGDGVLSTGDTLNLTETSTGNLRSYHVDAVATDIKAIKEPVICDKDLGCEFYGMKRIVDVAGYPHQERPMCPWHNSLSSVPIPHVVKSATYVAPFKVLGAAIDVYTQYPNPYGGQGPNNPSDMYWPQKQVCLFAKVTYNLWPEQQKDVAFEVIDPYGAVYTILCARTDADGIATICFRLPWMCDDPEYYFGEWNVIATVDVACEHINDTMNFKYDYMVHIWKVTTNEPSYAHGDYINVTVSYGSWALQDYRLLIAITGLDETGVPFDYGYVWIWVGGENAVYCTYANDTTSLLLYIPKWARAGKATIHVNALWPSLPRYGGVQQYPLVTVDVSIRAE